MGISLKERRRAIAYSMDILLPGFYFWMGPLTLNLGGSAPDDDPFRYPYTVGSWFGLALVWGDRTWSTPWAYIDDEEESKEIAAFLDLAMKDLELNPDSLVPYTEEQDTELEELLKGVIPYTEERSTRYKSLIKGVDNA